MSDTTKSKKIKKKTSTKKKVTRRKAGLQKSRRDGKMQQGIDYITYQTLTGAKSVRIDRHLRLCEIAPLLVRNTPTTVIIQTIREKFGCSASQIHDDIRLLIAQWQSENNQLLPVKALQVEKTAWEVVNAAMKTKQFNAVVSALRLISDIHGLKQPDQIAMLAISTDSEPSDDISVDEMMQAATRVLNKATRLKRAEERSRVINLADDQFEEDVA